jgi:hypothetical protein
MLSNPPPVPLRPSRPDHRQAKHVGSVQQLWEYRDADSGRCLGLGSISTTVSRCRSLRLGCSGDENDNVDKDEEKKESWQGQEILSASKKKISGSFFVLYPYQFQVLPLSPVAFFPMLFYSASDRQSNGYLRGPSISTQIRTTTTSSFYITDTEHLGRSGRPTCRIWKEEPLYRKLMRLAIITASRRNMSIVIHHTESNVFIDT